MSVWACPGGRGSTPEDHPLASLARRRRPSGKDRVERVYQPKLWPVCKRVPAGSDAEREWENRPLFPHRQDCTLIIASFLGLYFRAAGARVAGDGLRHYNPGTLAGPHRRAGRTLGGCRPSQRGDTEPAATGSAPARTASDWCRGSTRGPRHRVDAPPQGQPTRWMLRLRSSSSHCARYCLLGLCGGADTAEFVREIRERSAAGSVPSTAVDGPAVEVSY